MLDADEAVLRSRIEGSDEAMAWRLDHLDEYKAARSWMAEMADLVVDTVASTPPQIARRILAGLPDLQAKAGTAKADGAQANGAKPASRTAGPSRSAGQDGRRGQADTVAKPSAAASPDPRRRPDSAAEAGPRLRRKP